MCELRFGALGREEVENGSREVVEVIDDPVRAELRHRYVGIAKSDPDDGDPGCARNFDVGCSVCSPRRALTPFLSIAATVGCPAGSANCFNRATIAVTPVRTTRAKDMATRAAVATRW